MKRGSFRPHARVEFDVGGPSLTRQEFAKEADVNTLMARYQKTGVIPQSTAPMKYIDFAEMPDFHSAMNMMIEAEEAFLRLPAVVRRQFENDPASFVGYAADPANLDQMREWGLAPPAPSKPPQEAPKPSEAAPAPVPPTQ